MRARTRRLPLIRRRSRNQCEATASGAGQRVLRVVASAMSPEEQAAQRDCPSASSGPCVRIFGPRPVARPFSASNLSPPVIVRPAGRQWRKCHALQTGEYRSGSADDAGRIDGRQQRSGDDHVTTAPPARGHAPPEVGQLVRVGDRHWVVSDIQASSFGIDGGGGAAAAMQHLVELSSVEDDGLSQDLSVIWEIEPGATVLETATLPAPGSTASTTPNGSTPSTTPSGGVRSPRLTAGRYRHRSAPGSPSRTTSSTPSSEPSKCPGSTCSSPMTSASGND